MVINEMSAITHISPLTFYIDILLQYDNRPEIEKWLKDNAEKSYYMRMVYVSFKSKTDAVAFKLRWT